MPSFKRSAILLAVLFIALAVSSPGWAENRHHSFEFGATAEFTRFDSSSGLDSDTAPSLVVGFNFTKRHGMEVNYSTRTVPPDSGTFDTDIDSIALGYTYNAYPRDRIVSFFRAGGGYLSTRPQSTTDSVPDRLEEGDRSAFYYGGAGFRYFFNNTIAFRLDGMVRFVDENNGLLQPSVDGSLGMGAVFVIGGKDVEPPAE